MRNGRCYLHGGKTPGGMASPQFKTGRYSKYLPARLAGKYQDALADKHLLELRFEVALVDTRLAELIERVGAGESKDLWHTLKATNAELNVAIRSKDTAKMALAVRKIGELIDQGIGDHQAWVDVFDVIEQRRKLVESERKRLVEMQQMITSERAMLLIAALVDVVRNHVTDRDILAAISADVGKLITIDVSAENNGAR
jgi:hypothetical protein